MSTQIGSKTLRDLLFSTLGLGVASVVLNLIIKDWNKFVDLLLQLSEKPASLNPSGIANVSRISDGVLVLVSIGVQLLVRKKAAAQPPLVHTLSGAVVFLVFLAVLLIKHIAIVSYYFIRPDSWF